ncbi:SGNH/GDSL hydrolase family protein [Aeromicrobium sp. Root495]|uniref:SGNH/GDSL hydrolase family protein n=1 Tax=Aeromicrobium sp. Root495 TaxID=1736550 RepID=UPI001F25F475|nr:GDSL-type esterase/lipase family protein [Aeromicrobium sp. Root495]
MSFTYSNLNERGPGRVVSKLAWVLPGIRSVQAQVEPYAQWWAESNRRALDSGRGLWVVLGDSMSQGIGASAPDRGWVGQLLAEPPPRIEGLAALNLSFTGARVDDVAGRQLDALELVRDQGHRIELVTLLIGNNDLMSPRWRKTLDASMSALLDRVPEGTVVATQPGFQRAAASLNAVIEDAVRRRPLVVADFRVPHMRDWRGRLAQDHFHPNDRGYAGMASLVRDTLQGVHSAG